MSFLSRVWHWEIAKAFGYTSSKYPDINAASSIESGGITINLFLVDKKQARELSKSKLSKTSSNRSRPHRVFARCPICNELFPAGRLFQHVRRKDHQEQYEAIIAKAKEAAVTKDKIEQIREA